MRQVFALQIPFDGQPADVRATRIDPMGLAFGDNSMFAPCGSPTLVQSDDCLAVVSVGSQTELYRRAQTGLHGAHFYRYAALPTGTGQGPADAFIQSWPRYCSSDWFFCDDAGYTKWEPTLELERKFTFDGIPDTWRLITALHDDILVGRLKGFVPEGDREFQVFDYESHMFEVTSPPSEVGYVALIPQVDGLVTVKRKWFQQNAELRREQVTANTSVQGDYLGHVRGICQGDVSPLPGFRRKRFDVNFESLHTGNVYGVYFDICRSLAPALPAAFAQCEVEYCRSRTPGIIRSVLDEWEVVCDFVADWLRASGASFERNLYSKLDFVRSVAARRGEAAA